MVSSKGVEVLGFIKPYQILLDMLLSLTFAFYETPEGTQSENFRGCPAQDPENQCCARRLTEAKQAGRRIWEIEQMVKLRWILRILHDPRYLIPWEFWCYSILESCRILRINRMLSTREERRKKLGGLGTMVPLK